VVPTPQQPTEADKARQMVTTGALVSTGACVFGGLMAVALAALNQKGIAGVVAILAGLVVLWGAWQQYAGLSKLKKANGGGK
jgi:hypothetical protein